ncbi:hypothetical protein [Liquorilactobacillus uvarum]|uniref:Methyl-accepting chemotaxis protein n=1 Tax=Liquorilactobacillus uvarum DSM 19971 TaxID=1423812 RepID=A0A0R1PX34_9LACO|nr:hypothetical protein [Liquorilactobacillus uvarum]KRL37025.1 hypothetical protein FD20_GL000738 [Liquorilactobacillus uvarum DSM 19971]
MYAGSQSLSESSKKVTEKNDVLNKLSQSSPAVAGNKTEIITQGHQRVAKAMSKISDGQGKITQSIALIAQSEELKTALRHIKHEKDDKITQAFSKTYIFAAVFVLICSPIALWSEKRKA